MSKKEYLACKCCEYHCPVCGAGDKDIEWGDFEFGEVSSIPGTCLKCGEHFTEFYKYTNTEWDMKNKKYLTPVKHDIEIKVAVLKVKIHLTGQDGFGRWLGGTVESNLKQDPPKGTVENESEEETFAREKFNSMMDGIESFLLALACNNVKIDTPAFESALITALDACINHCD